MAYQMAWKKYTFFVDGLTAFVYVISMETKATINFTNYSVIEQNDTHAIMKKPKGKMYFYAKKVVNDGFNGGFKIIASTKDKLAFV